MKFMKYVKPKEEVLDMLKIYISASIVSQTGSFAWLAFWYHFLYTGPRRFIQGPH